MKKRAGEKLYTQPIDNSEQGVVSFETFRSFGSYERVNLTQKEPSCFNGVVSIRKYKVTVEPINEPNEVLAERLQHLWDVCDNYHHCEPLRVSAKKIGYELKGSVGDKRKK